MIRLSMSGIRILIFTCSSIQIKYVFVLVNNKKYVDYTGYKLYKKTWF